MLYVASPLIEYIRYQQVERLRKLGLRSACLEESLQSDRVFAFVVDEVHVHTACGDLVRTFQISFNMLTHIQNILSQSPCRVLKRNNTIVCTAVC